jgi:hypothetical protein
MFSGLNQEIRKPEVVEPVIARVLRNTGLIVVSTVVFSALYASILLLAIGGYMLSKDSPCKSKRFSIT